MFWMMVGAVIVGSLIVAVMSIVINAVIFGLTYLTSK